MIALRQYQDAARTAIEDQWRSGVKKTLLVLVTGGGKTIIFAKVIENCVRNGERVLVLAHRGELLEQAADKLQMVTGLGCAVEKADQSCQGSWFRVVVGSVQTLMQEKRLSQFPPDYFDTIVVDEAHHCCPAGTMVGNMSIEHIQPGDVVPAYNHATGKAASRHVIGVMSRRVSEIYQLRLSNGTTLCCTGGHPIWNGTAYVRCNTLRAGDWIFEKGGNPLELSEIHEAQDMLDLRDSIYPEIMELNDDPILLGSMRSDCERSEAQDRKRDMRRLRESFCPVGKKAIPSHKRANLLFKRMQRKVCANRQGENDVGNQQAIRVGADEDQKPYAKRRIERKDEKQPKGTPIYPSGRERADDETARRACAGASRNLLGALRNRISNCYERREEVRRQDTKLLQGRYRLPECQAVDRGGWEKPFDGGGERERRTENRDLAPIRVVGITVHQRGSGREFERLCPGGVVYNLEVERDNNYFANGILVHNCLSSGYQRVLSHFDGAKVLGVTATPDRGDMRNLGQYFESLAYEYTLPRAIKEGFLAPIKALTIPLTLDITGVGTQSGDYKCSELGTALDPYLYQIADEMVSNCTGRKSVVFLPLVATSQKMCAILNDKGLRAAEVNGKSADRADVIAAFGRGDYDVLCNSMLLTEGWDCPSVDCVVVLRPTKVRSLYCQMVGRGTRLCPGKDHLLLLDFLWHTEKHELCRPAHLICDSDDVADRMTQNLEAASTMPGAGAVDIEDAKQVATDDVVASREDALAEALREMKHRKRKLVDPLQFEMSIQAEDLSGYVPAFGWEMGPASDKQRATLEKLGIFPDEITCSGKAAKILDRLDKRREAGLTTPRQISLLEQKGFKHVGAWPFDATRKLIDRIAGNGWKVPCDINPADYRPKSLNDQ